MLIKILLLLCTGLLYSQPLVSGQEGSFLETVIKSEESIVTINALVAQAQSPQQSAALDPKTGRILVARSLRTAQFQRYGAGVIIHPDGLIVTNVHTIRSAQKIAVKLHDGTTLAAKVLEMSGKHDLALIKIDPPYPLKAIEVADSNLVQLGDHVVNIGNSELLKNTISGGRVVGLGTSTLDNGRTNSIELIKVNMNFYKGDSGGPLLNRDGELIGMIVAKQLKVDKVSYAIPANKIKKLYLQFIK